MVVGERGIRRRRENFGVCGGERGGGRASRFEATRIWVGVITGVGGCVQNGPKCNYVISEPPLKGP